MLVPNGFGIKLGCLLISFKKRYPSKLPGYSEIIIKNNSDILNICFKDCITLLIYNSYNDSYYIFFKMNNLILIRHGQSIWNLERRFTGFVDVELTKHGEMEAKLAGQFIKELDIKFDYFFTSQLKRAFNSLNIILKVLNTTDAKINKAWELNERHYGGLTGLNKDDTIKKYGQKQVKIWRRSFNTRPPPMENQHPYKNKIKSNITSESLEDTIKRVLPYYEKNIKPLIASKKNVLIVFHGNSCRALLMKILNISRKKIIEFEIPTGNPLLIKFADNLKVKDFKYLDAKRSKKIIFNN